MIWGPRLLSRRLLCVIGLAAVAVAVSALAGSAAATDLSGATATARATAFASATASTGAAAVSFLPPLGKKPAAGTNAGWLLPFLTVEVCELSGASCGRVVASFTAAGSGQERLRLNGEDEDDDEGEGGGSHFRAVWHTKDAGLVEGAGYRLRVLVGPMEVGQRNLLVSLEGFPKGKGNPEADPFPIRPGASLPVKFRIDEQSFLAGLASLTATPGSSPAGGVVGLAANPSGSASGQLQLFVAGRPAPVRARPQGGLVAGVPLFLDASRFPAPPAGPVDLLLFSDGVAVAAGRSALTVLPLRDAPGSAGQARLALDGIAGAFGRIGDALATQPGTQEQWLTGSSSALRELVSGSDPRSLAGALAASDPAERRLLDAWFAASGMLAALRQYEEMVGQAAASFEQQGTFAGLTMLRALSMTSSGVATGALAAPTPASTSFPTDLELSEAMQFYETVKDFGETVVAATNTQFNLYVGIAAGAIGLVKGVPAVAIITAVLAIADFAINELFIALLPANIDRFELILASVLLDPGETTDAVLHLDAVNDPPPIGIQDVIGTILGVLGIKDAPAIESLTDALLQTATTCSGSSKRRSAPTRTSIPTSSSTRRSAPSPRCAGRQRSPTQPWPTETATPARSSRASPTR